MTSETSDKPRPRRPETGWARAQRLRGKNPLRTCLPAVIDRTDSDTSNTGMGEIIVRGED
ncbi:hypothetical protein HCJ93_01375 [Streptomyces sp. SBST2-5]|uniref:Uncharacterized protein n=2 Tax=Streptomyces TaxID=1883 RepID=A0ABN1HN84_9ACTN|nr:hypothetical protein [Streptomyces composti]NJP48759.1 hypothetical protein [Streptomyces composti]